MSYTGRRTRAFRRTFAALVTAALAALAVLAAGVPAAAIADEPATPVRLVGTEHPLAGRIWSVREGRFVDEEAVLRDVRGARYLLLGERHGNPEHHRLQGRLIRAAAEAGRPIALVAEQLDAAQQPAIDACRRDCTDLGAQLGERVGWAQSGWPAYALYEPVFAAAAASGAAVYAGNPGAKRVRALSGGGTPEGDEAAWLEAARQPLPASGRERLVEDLAAGHCGHLPKEYAESLVLAQRLRDASMAAALQRGRGENGVAVLVAGTGHVRRDYGVPTLLRAPRTVVVAFTEVAAGENVAEDYGPRDAYDYLWFTARVDEPDPCEQFRERLEKMKPVAK